MNFLLEPVSGPEIEPITLEEMKRHLRVYPDVTTEDDDITGLIVSAREWAEGYTGRALIDQTWRLTIHAGVNSVLGSVRTHHWMRNGGILLRRAPIIAVTKVASVDAAGIETELDAATYTLQEKDSKWPWLRTPNGERPTGTLRMEYRAGFADRFGSPKQDASVVPTRFKQGMKLWAEAMYDRDQYTMELLLRVAAEILKPERSDLQLA